MNRDIKFRGLDINGNWHYGLLAHTENKKVCREIGWFICNSEGSPFAYHIRPETVGQFTGLRDKNGVEIYEGDVVFNYKKTLLTLNEDPRTYLVTWKEGEWNKEGNWLKINPGFYFNKIQPKGLNCMELIFSNNQIEVIGNIYQNPELLTPATGRKEE